MASGGPGVSVRKLMALCMRNLKSLTVVGRGQPDETVVCQCAAQRTALLSLPAGQLGLREPGNRPESRADGGVSDKTGWEDRGQRFCDSRWGSLAPAPRGGRRQISMQPIAGKVYSVGLWAAKAENSGSYISGSDRIISGSVML